MVRIIYQANLLTFLNKKHCKSKCLLASNTANTFSSLQSLFHYLYIIEYYLYIPALTLSPHIINVFVILSRDKNYFDGFVLPLVMLHQKLGGKKTPLLMFFTNYNVII